MNIAQAAMFQTKRVEGKKPVDNVPVGSAQSLKHNKFKSSSFSRVFEKSLGETGSSKTKQFDRKPEVDKPDAGKPDTGKPANGTAAGSKSNGDRVIDSKPGNRSEDRELKTERCTCTETEMKTETGTGNSETPEANSITNDLNSPLQVMDLLKLLGVSVNQDGSVAQSNDATQTGSEQSVKADNLLKGQGLTETVLRLIEALGELNGKSSDSDFTPFLEQLKRLTDTGASVNSLHNDKLLRDLAQTLGEAIKEVSGQSVSSVTQSAGAENSLTVSKPVVNTSFSEGLGEAGSTVSSPDIAASDKKNDESLNRESGNGRQGDNASAGVRVVGSKKIGADSAKNIKNEFSLQASEMFDQGKPVISGQGFNTASNTSGIEQSTPLYKLTQGIFGQIAQKAKVVIMPGVTEMQIQLKPEVLGKLNMSIISENGSVTARFSAESHAVKAIIEANLNSLKDALTQQGVKVDQLIVDVGTQNHQPGFDQRENMYRGNKSTGNNRVSVNAEELDRIFSTETHSGVLKNYYGSTVEFTA